MIYHIEKKDPFIEKIALTCYSYQGQKIKIQTENIPQKLNSYWDCGSKDSYVFYELATGKALEVASNHPYFEKDNPNYLEALPKGLLLVRHSVFCGKDMGLTIYANPEDIAKALPAPLDASQHEKIVLRYTQGLKNTYGGRTNIRFTEANEKEKITLEEWNAASDSCKAKGYLNKIGAITPKGENALQGYRGKL